MYSFRNHGRTIRKCTCNKLSNRDKQISSQSTVNRRMVFCHKLPRYLSITQVCCFCFKPEEFQFFKPQHKRIVRNQKQVCSKKQIHKKREKEHFPAPFPYIYLI